MITVLTSAAAASQGTAGTNWGTVIVAGLGFVGIIVTQILTGRRDKAQLAHQVAAALRQRRLDAYSELIEACNDLMLTVPEVLTTESDGGSLNAKERSPMNAAASKAHLLASEPVQEKITALVDAVYSYANGLAEDAWGAFDDAQDAFVDAVRDEDDHGNILSNKNQRKDHGRKQSGG